MTSSSSTDSLHEQVAAQLARTDQRYTASRRRLIEALSGAGRPLTLPEILQAAPDVAQSSAYRNLDVLERSGVVRRIAVGGDHTHFELSEPLLDHHHHLICIACGTIIDVELDAAVEAAVDASLAAAAARIDFRPLHHSLDLHGHCANCDATGAP